MSDAKAIRIPDDPIVFMQGIPFPIQVKKDFYDANIGLFSNGTQVLDDEVFNRIELRIESKDINTNA